jgi:hypothetical protein
MVTLICFGRGFLIQEEEHADSYDDENRSYLIAGIRFAVVSASVDQTH